MPPRRSRSCATSSAKLILKGVPKESIGLIHSKKYDRDRLRSGY